MVRLLRGEDPDALSRECHGTYELSGGILSLGWWAFLPAGKEERLYSELAAALPLPRKVKSLYHGPGTTRNRHPLLDGVNRLENGFRELICRLAARLARHSP